jgi:hypothetical protein
MSRAVPCQHLVLARILTLLVSGKSEPSVIVRLVSSSTAANSFLYVSNASGEDVAIIKKVIKWQNEDE